MKMFRVLFALLLVLALPWSAHAKLILGDTNDTVEVITATAVSTINVYASWVDITTTAMTPGMTNTLITLGAPTTTTVVAAPGASTYRQVKMLTIYNSHASSSDVITVQVYDGTNRAVLVKYTLLAGETLQWSEDENFRVFDASGQIKVLTSADTEMPAAAALADNTANPTVPGVAAFLMCYDGSTWDRCQGGLTDIDDGTIAGAQVPSLIIPLNYVYDGTNWVRETRGTAGTAAAQVLTIQGIASMTPILATVTATNLDVQSGGADLATETTAAAILTSTNFAAAFGTAGSADSQVMSIQGIASMTPIKNEPTAATSGGCSLSSVLSAASVNETEVKATAGQVYWIQATNVNAAAAYLKFYNDTAANVDETDTPVLRLAIPGATTAGGFTTNIPVGAVFSTAITYRVTTAVADSSTAAVASNEVLINVCYK